MDILAEFMSATINAFEANKRLADRAVEQVPDDKLHSALDANTNSIAVIMKHVAGNLTSRWTDFLTTDGEKPWRNRDDEFVDSVGSRAELLESWERSWTCLLKTLKSLKLEDLEKTVMIRGEPHSVPLALERLGPHLLPRRPDRPGRPNPRRGKVEYPDDSQGRFGPIQQGELGPNREVAFVDHVSQRRIYSLGVCDEPVRRGSHQPGQ